LSETPKDDLPEEYPASPKPYPPPVPPEPTEMSSDSTSDSGDWTPTAHTPPPQPTPVGGSVYGRGANRLNLLGYLSIVFGVIGTGCCCCPWLNGAPLVGGIPAVILGVMHVMRVNKGQATQKWLGWLGIVLGVVAIVAGICEFTTDWDTRITDEYNRQVGNM
jgi:hypothetical protein